MDSGCTNHLTTTTAAQHLVNLTSERPLQVQLPDGSSLISRQSGTLAVGGLPKACTAVRVVIGLEEPSLLSIAPFCDQNMRVTFTRHDATIVDAYGKVVLSGSRNHETSLWEFDPTANTDFPDFSLSPAVSQANRIFHCPQEDNQLVQFFHAALCSPAESTLIQALDAGFVQFPGLSSRLVRKFPQQSWATAKGHLDRTRQGILSSKPTSADAQDTEYWDQDSLGSTPEVPDPDSSPAKAVSVAVIHVDPTGIVSSDPTGRLPVTSARGHQYIMVLFSTDANYILPIPMINRSKEEHMRAFAIAHAFFNARGFPSVLHVMDNESAADTRQFLAESQIQTQLVPPSNHRANKAERAIRTFKNHFIAALSGLPSQFPQAQWDHLLPQIELTLNLLRRCRIKPQISAWEAVNGAYSYSKHPIAPLGTPILIFDAPDARRTFAAHGAPGFYLGPSFDHYRCFNCWSSTTHSTRVSDTVSWHPVSAPFPVSHPQHLLLRVREYLQRSDLLIPQARVQAAIEHLDAALETVATIRTRDIPTNNEGPHTPPGFAPFRALNPFEGRNARPKPPPPQHLFAPPVPPAPVPRVEDLPAAEIVWPSPHEEPTPLPRVDTPPTPPAPTLTLEATLNTQPAEPTAIEHIQPPATPELRRSTRLRRPNSLYPAEASVAAVSLPPMSTLLRGPDCLRWMLATEQEFTRLATEWKVMEFIPFRDMPKETRPHLWNAIPSIKTDAEGNHKMRVRGCVNPAQQDHTQDVAALTAALPAIKILLNITATEDRVWSSADIKDYYLHSQLPAAEYMRIPFKSIPTATQSQFKLHQMYAPGSKCALVRVTGAIFGLPQSGRIAQDDLIPRLAAAGYHQFAHTPMVFSNASRSVMFSLVVDDFGISSKSTADTEHLLGVLRASYQITYDPTGRKYLGMRIRQDHKRRAIYVDMPGYVQDACAEFKVKRPTKPVRTPLPYNRPNYGQKEQSPIEDDTPLLDAAGKLFVQQVVGKFQYYAHAIDFSMLAALSKIASKQSAPTQHTMELLLHFLAYAVSNPAALIVYRASSMILWIHSDAAFLTEWKARSRTAGIFYLGFSGIDDPINGVLDAQSVIMKNVVPSVAEAEYGSIFANAQYGIPLRNMLADFGYPQPPTIIVTDNACAMGIANKTLKARRSKSMDVRFHWIQDQIKLRNYQVVWRPGSQNLADFVSKIHPPSHNEAMCDTLLTDTPPVSILDLPSPKLRPPLQTISEGV